MVFSVKQMFHCNHLFCRKCCTDLAYMYGGTSKCVCPLCRSAEKIPENNYELCVKNITTDEIKSLLAYIAGTANGSISYIEDGTNCSTETILGRPEFIGLSVMASSEEFGDALPLESRIAAIDKQLASLDERLASDRYAPVTQQIIIARITNLNFARNRLCNFV